MSRRKKWKIDRRKLLQGMGTSIALPFLEAMLPEKAQAQNNAKDHKLLMCYQPQGCFMNGSGNRNFPSYLVPLYDSIKNDISRIQDMNFHDLYGQSDHYQIPMIIYCPDKTTRNGTQHTIAGKSFDNIIAESVFPNHRAKHIAIVMSDSSWVPEDRYNKFQSSKFSWLSETTPNDIFRQPRELFNYLFSDFGNNSNAQQIAERKAFKKSILDYVKNDVNAVMQNLGSEDKMRMEGYLESLRDLERRVDALDVPVECNPGTGIIGGHPNFPPTMTYSNLDQSYPERMALFQDLVVKAYECDITGVVSFAHGGELCGVEHSWLNLTGTNNWHTNSHYSDPDFAKDRGFEDASQDVLTANIKKITEWHNSQYVTFIQKLKNNKDLTGKSLFDNFVSVYHSGMSDSRAHNCSKVHAFVAGAAGGALKTGGPVIDHSNNPGANLWLTLLNSYGLNMSKWANSNGEVTALKV